MASDPTLQERAVEAWRISPITALLIRRLLPAVGALLDHLDAADATTRIAAEDERARPAWPALNQAELRAALYSRNAEYASTRDKLERVKAANDEYYAELTELRAMRKQVEEISAGIEWDPAWRRAARHILNSHDERTPDVAP